MKIALASDHGGYSLKETLKNYFIDCQVVPNFFLKRYRRKLGKPLKNFNQYSIVDFGTNSSDSVDYPDYIQKASLAVSQNECDLGIVLCSSGVGASIVANKFYKIRAALCFNVEMARLAKQHNNANILVLGAKYVTPNLAIEMIEEWISSEFLGERHQRRLDKIDLIEKQRNNLIKKVRDSA